MTTKIAIPGTTAYLTSKSAGHDVTLFTGNADASDTEVPMRHDVVSISFPDGVPDGLEAAEIHIGGTSFHWIDVSGIRPGENILDGQVLPLSKAYYMVAKLVLRYSADFLRARERTKMVEETKHVEELSETDTEIYDGVDYHVGRRVTRTEVPTDRMVSKIVEGVDVAVPGILVETEESAEWSETSPTLIPVWQRIKVFPRKNAGLIRDHVQKQTIRLLDDMTVDKCVDDGEPFWCMYKNTARFERGMAGLMYCW